MTPSERQHTPPESVIRLLEAEPTIASGLRSWFVRSRSFLVSWTEATAVQSDDITVESPEEYFLLLPDVAADLVWSGGHMRAGPRTVVVMPAGHTAVTMSQPGRAIRLFAPEPAEFASIPVHGDGHATPQVQDLDPRFRRRDRDRAGPMVYELDALPNSPGMPRARLFQSATMSINWVEYMGPRDRSRLSPHAHADFQQGSLALHGTFVHHLRTPWSPDAQTWREDIHERCGAGSIALIPPTIVHTTEGVGDMPHALIDIFAPPRRDFIAKGQVLNARDYSDLISTQETT
jgi:hypothetical protein